MFVFAIPTDTVYGITAFADDNQSIEKIYDIKGRSFSKKLAIFAPSYFYVYQNIARKDQVSQIKDIVNKYQDMPTTLIIKAKKGFLKNISPHCYDVDKVAVRVVRHESVNKFFSENNNKIIAVTSLNLSGEEEITDFRNIPNSIKESLSLIIEGDCVSGVPSKIIDCETGNVIRS